MIKDAGSGWTANESGSAWITPVGHAAAPVAGGALHTPVFDVATSPAPSTVDLGFKGSVQRVTVTGAPVGPWLETLRLIKNGADWFEIRGFDPVANTIDLIPLNGSATVNTAETLKVAAISDLLGGLRAAPEILADQAGLSVGVSAATAPVSRALDTDHVIPSGSTFDVRLADDAAAFTAADLNKVFLDADGRAYRLVAIDGDGLGGELVAQWAKSTGSAPTDVPTGLLRPIALDVARTEPTSEGGLAAQRVFFADSGAPLGDWTTQVVADGEALRLSDGTNDFIVLSVDTTNGSAVLRAVDGLSTVASPSTLSFGSDTGYARLPLFAGDLTVTAVKPAKPQVFATGDTSALTGDGLRVLEITADPTTGAVNSLVSSNILTRIAGGSLQGSAVGAGTDTGLLLDGNAAQFQPTRSNVSYHVLGTAADVVGGSDWLQLTLTVVNDDPTGDWALVMVDNTPDPVTEPPLTAYISGGQTFDLTPAQIDTLLAGLASGLDLHLVRETTGESDPRVSVAVDLSTVVASFTTRGITTDELIETTAGLRYLVGSGDEIEILSVPFADLSTILTGDATAFTITGLIEARPDRACGSDERLCGTHGLLVEQCQSSHSGG